MSSRSVVPILRFGKEGLNSACAGKEPIDVLRDETPTAAPKTSPRPPSSARAAAEQKMLAHRKIQNSATIKAEGVEAVKVNGLARRAGVSVAAPFRHFPSRQALLVALAEEGAQRLQQRMEAAARAYDDPVEAHRARGVAYVRFAVEEPAYLTLLSRADILAASPVLRQMSAMNIEAMDGVLGKRQGGEVSPLLVRRTAGVLAAQALTFGLARMIVDGLLGDITADQAERLAHEVTGVLGEGL